jgi:hypothetical protein
MEKKEIKPFNKKGILDRFISLSNQERAYRKNISKIGDKKQEIYEEIEKGFKVVEKTELYFQLKEKFLQNEEIKAIIEKYQIPADHIALIQEYVDDFEYPYPWMKEWTVAQFQHALENNALKAERHYLYGGPRDELKVMFRDCHNGHYVLAGFQFKFSKKQKRDWKATFKGKKTA